MTEVYLDNNATTRPLPEVRAAVLRALDEGYGNPSSARFGQRRRCATDRTRQNSSSQAHRFITIERIERPGGTTE